jgi:hypothetical protein
MGLRSTFASLVIKTKFPLLISYIISVTSWFTLHIHTIRTYTVATTTLKVKLCK